MDPERRMNILMVDDEPSNLVALEAILEGLGQTLVKVTSGQEALRKVLEQDFAVILLDVQMPDVNGIEVAAMIRERERSRHIPIIFLTGAGRTSEMMFKGYSAGAVDYLMKPIVPDVLRAKVEVFVELAQVRKKLEQEVIERRRIAAEVSGLNEELEQKNRELLAANADLESFSYSVSHDLRAPIRHINGYLEVLEESASKKLDATEKSRIERIKKATARMGNLVDDLLAFSRLGRAPLVKVEFSTDDLVAEMISDLAPDFADRKIIWDVQPLPKSNGDKGLLRQVWANLLGNAVKYSKPRDPARIQIAAEEQEAEVVFRVQDNGVGFEMKYAGRLFGVFSRLHSSEEFEGSGVGLANVRKIVHRHGGRTWATSEIDQGSTFFFSLPRAVQEPEG